MIVSAISVGIFFIHIPILARMILFLCILAVLITFAFLRIGNIYADKYFFNILKYIFRKKIYIHER